MMVNGLGSKLCIHIYQMAKSIIMPNSELGIRFEMACIQIWITAKCNSILNLCWVHCCIFKLEEMVDMFRIKTRRFLVSDLTMPPLKSLIVTEAKKKAFLSSVLYLFDEISIIYLSLNWALIPLSSCSLQKKKLREWTKEGDSN